MTEYFTLVIATAENEAYEQSNQKGQLAGLVRLASFINNMHLTFLHVFSYSIEHFFSVINNIPMSGYTTVYLFIYLLKGILFSSNFWQV